MSELLANLRVAALPLKPLRARALGSRKTRDISEKRGDKELVDERPDDRIPANDRKASITSNWAQVAAGLRVRCETGYCDSGGEAFRSAKFAKRTGAPFAGDFRKSTVTKGRLLRIWADFKTLSCRQARTFGSLCCLGHVNCRLAERAEIFEDDISRYRRVQGGWSDKDADKRLLITNRLPGRIAQLQGFRGTACAVSEKEGLRRVLAAEDSQVYQGIVDAKGKLAIEIEAAVQRLHWKDFEILIDLVFRQVGWRRRSVLGKTMKYVDLELVEPMTEEAYQVQIKSRADVCDFEEYVANFSNEGFRNTFTAVYTPTPALAKTQSASDEVELMLPDRVAELVIDHGLVGWLLDRVR